MCTHPPSCNLAKMTWIWPYNLVIAGSRPRAPPPGPGPRHYLELSVSSYSLLHSCNHAQRTKCTVCPRRFVSHFFVISYYTRLLGMTVASCRRTVCPKRLIHSYLVSILWKFDQTFGRFYIFYVQELSWPILYSNLLYQMGHCFPDNWYI